MRRCLLAISLVLGCGPSERAPSGSGGPSTTAPSRRMPGSVAALAVGQRATDFELPARIGEAAGRASLADALTRGERALIVFYRGDW
jgi:hypothetical protein